MIDFTNSQIGYFISRYKRFFMNLKVENTILTCYCPNNGKMADLLDEGNKCCFVPQTSTIPFRVEAIFAQNEWVGINTGIPNKLVKDLLIQLFPNRTWTREFSFQGYRCDFISDKTIIEVKNVHWKKDEWALFPDCISTRASRQMDVLIDLKKKGWDPIVIYIVQRMSINKVSSSKVDKLYFQKVKAALEVGIQFRAFKCNIDNNGVAIESEVPFRVLEDQN